MGRRGAVLRDWWAWVSVLVASAIALVLRLVTYRSATEPLNIDATWHQLLTVLALDESGLRKTLGLPVVTLQQASELGVSWGGALVDYNGLGYYLSFPPGSFQALWAFFRVTGAPLTVDSLIVFNSLVGLGAGLLAFALARTVAELAGAGRRHAAVVGVLVSVVQTFAVESLFGNGEIYWAHSLFQPFLFAQFLLVLRLLTGRSRGRVESVLLIAACFFAVWTEWTGVLSTAAVALSLCVAALRADGGRRTRLLLTAIASGVGGMAALGLYLGLITRRFGFQRAIDTILARGASRSGESFGTPVDVLLSWRESYGPVILLVAVIAVLTVANPHSRSVLRRVPHVLWWFLLASAVPLVENFLLTGHSLAYTFDRLKLALPLVVLLALLLAAWRARVALVLAAVGVVIASSQGAATYASDLRRLDFPAYESNASLAATVRSEYPDAAYFSTLDVRGYTNLTWRQNIRDSPVTSWQQFTEACSATGRAQCVWVIAVPVRGGMYAWPAAVVFDTARGATSLYTAPDAGPVPEWLAAQLSEDFDMAGSPATAVPTESGAPVEVARLTPRTTETLTVAFLGDSITAGLGASSPSTRWSSVLSATRGWTELNFGLSGTGYAASDRTLPALTCEQSLCGDFATSAAAALRRAPDAVVLSGGYNDIPFVASGGRDVAAGIDRTFDLLCSDDGPRWLVVMGPLSVHSRSDAELTWIDEAVRARADDCGAAFLPGARRWVADDDRFPAPDGVHPGDEGMAEIARRVDAELSRLVPGLR